MEDTQADGIHALRPRAVRDPLDAASSSAERSRSGNRVTGLRYLTDFLAVASTDLVLWRLTTNQLDYMKIIHQGQYPPKPEPQWWTLQTLKCGHCATTLQLEESDSPRFGYVAPPPSKRWVQIDCPTCGKRIDHIEVAMRGASPENV